MAITMSAERRSIGRTIINRNASLLLVGRPGLVSCSVHDVTNHGAGIRLNCPSALPIDFELSFDNFRTARNCHLVWRNGDFLGVRLVVPGQLRHGV
jgi:hypothetical protein